jgi:hypothetical protein
MPRSLPPHFTQKNVHTYLPEQWLAEKKITWRQLILDLQPITGLQSTKTTGVTNVGHPIALRRRWRSQRHLEASDSSWPNVTQVAVLCWIRRNFVDKHCLKLQEKFEMERQWRYKAANVKNKHLKSLSRTSGMLSLLGSTGIFGCWLLLCLILLSNWVLTLLSKCKQTKYQGSE